MKKILFIITLMSIFSCKEKNKEKEVHLIQEPVESLEKKSKVQDFNSKFLNGVWVENDEDNALFEIKNDTLRYVEYYETPYLISIEKNNFVIKYLDNKILSENSILKLSKDSLVLKTDDDKYLKLFNRRN